MKIGSYKGVKYFVTFSKEKFDKVVAFSALHWKAISATMAAIVLTFMLAGCDVGREDAPVTAAKFCPSVMVDSIDMSPYEDRVKALAIEAQSKGITITGDYAADVAAQGGEMTLVGAVRVEVDSNCQVVSAGSWMSLFNADRYPITGGIDPQGNLGMDANFGGAIVNIRGQIVDGKVTNGKALKSWLPHIYGVFDPAVQVH